MEATFSVPVLGKIAFRQQRTMWQKADGVGEGNLLSPVHDDLYVDGVCDSQATFALMRSWHLSPQRTSRTPS